MSDEHGQRVAGGGDGAGGGGRRVTRRWFLLIGAAVLGGAAGVTELIRRVGERGGASSLGGLLDKALSSFPVNSVEKVPDVAAAEWVVSIDGMVERPLRLDREAWRSLPRYEKTSDFHCVEGWTVDDVRWGGVAPAVLLERAGLAAGATHVVFHAFGGTYVDSLPLDLVRHPLTVLADELDGRPLPPQHGGPLRLVVPVQLGYKSVKWVTRLEVTDHAVTGYWERRGYPMDAPAGG